MQNQSSATDRPTPQPQQEYTRFDGVIFRVMTVTESGPVLDGVGDRTMPVSLIQGETASPGKLLIQGGTDRITKRAKPLSHPDPKRRAKSWLQMGKEITYKPHVIYYLLEGADLDLLAMLLDEFLGWDIRGQNGCRFELKARAPIPDLQG
jgi:hypothetical protein